MYMYAMEKYGGALDGDLVSNLDFQGQIGKFPNLIPGWSASYHRNDIDRPHGTVILDFEINPSPEGLCLPPQSPLL